MKKKIAFIFALFLMMFLFPVFNNQVTVQADNNAEEVIYKQVKSVSELSTGDYLIIASKDHKVAMSTTDNGKSRNQTNVFKYTVGNDTYLVANESTQIITVGYPYGGAYQLKVGNYYLIGATDTESALSTKLSIGSYITAYWNIVINDDGSASIYSMKYYIDNIIRYNTNEQIFACYSNESLYSDIAIFKECLDAPAHIHNSITNFDEQSHTQVCSECESVLSTE